MNNDAWLLVAVGGFFVVVFVALQVVGWRSTGVIIGGSRRAAQIAMGAAAVACLVQVLCLLIVGLNIRAMSGGPFILFYTASVLSAFVMPALLVIELILLAESAITTRCERGAWVWHLGALVPCAAWLTALVIAPGLEVK